MSNYTPYGFDGDDYDEYDDGQDDAPVLQLAEAATRCIEHDQLPCAVCDGVMTGTTDYWQRCEAREPLTLAA